MRGCLEKPSVEEGLVLTIPSSESNIFCTISLNKLYFVILLYYVNDVSPALCTNYIQLQKVTAVKLVEGKKPEEIERKGVNFLNSHLTFSDLKLTE